MRLLLARRRWDDDDLFVDCGKARVEDVDFLHGAFISLVVLADVISDGKGF